MSVQMVEGKPVLGRSRRSGGDGRPEVFCADEQQAQVLDLGYWRSLALEVLMARGVRGAAELNVMFVDEPSIAALNEQYMEKSGPTDVLAFPMDGYEVVIGTGPGAQSRGPGREEPAHDEAPLILGDVVVCPAVAAAQAPSHAGTFEDEIALLLVHGILHVLGHDHDTDEAAAEMRAIERELLETHHWRGPAPAGFRQEQP